VTIATSVVFLCLVLVLAKWISRRFMFTKVVKVDRRYQEWSE
jgi:hypothetical protein